MIVVLRGVEWTVRGAMRRLRASNWTSMLTDAAAAGHGSVACDERPVIPPSSHPANCTFREHGLGVGSLVVHSY